MTGHGTATELASGDLVGKGTSKMSGEVTGKWHCNWQGTSTWHGKVQRSEEGIGMVNSRHGNGVCQWRDQKGGKVTGDCIGNAVNLCSKEPNGIFFGYSYPYYKGISNFQSITKYNSPMKSLRAKFY